MRWGTPNVAGTSRGEGTGDDYATVMYDTDDVEQWAARYDHPGGDSDEIFGMASDSESDVYVTGASCDEWFANDYATIGCSNDSVTGVGETPSAGGATPPALALSAPRPNPSRGRIDVSYDVACDGATVSVAVCDLRGRLVKRIAEGRTPGGCHTTTWDGTDETGRRVATGVYFVRLSSHGEVRTRKAIVLR